jgi:hypothetical protein
MYSIIKDKTVEIFNEGTEYPFCYQPCYPDGTPFSSDEEAQTWANQYIEFANDPNALCYQNSPNEERKPRAIIDLREARIRATGILPEDIEWVIRQKIANGELDAGLPAPVNSEE